MSKFLKLRFMMSQHKSTCRKNAHTFEDKINPLIIKILVILLISNKIFVQLYSGSLKLFKKIQKNQ